LSYAPGRMTGSPACLRPALPRVVRVPVAHRVSLAPELHHPVLLQDADCADLFMKAGVPAAPEGRRAVNTSLTDSTQASVPLPRQGSEATGPGSPTAAPTRPNRRPDTQPGTHRHRHRPQPAMTRLRPGAATRATLALAVPAAVGGATGHAALGGVAGIAGLLTALTDLGYDMRSWRNLQFTAVLMPVMVVFGVLLTPNHLLLAMLFATTMGFAGLLYAVSPLTKAATMGPALCVVIVAGMHIPRRDGAAAFAAAVAGVLFALVLSLVAAQIRHTARHDPRPLGQTLLAAWTAVRSEIRSPRNAIVAYAAVLALVSFASLLVATLIDPAHAFWVAMAAVVIVKPDPITTLKRAFQRLLGTVVAIGVTVGLVALDLPTGFVIAVVAGMLFVGVAFVTASPVVAAFGTAPLPLVGAVGSSAATQVLGSHRVIDTAAGISVSIVTMIAFQLLLHQLERRRRGHDPAGASPEGGDGAS